MEHRGGVSTLNELLAGLVLIVDRGWRPFRSVIFADPILTSPTAAAPGASLESPGLESLTLTSELISSAWKKEYSTSSLFEHIQADFRTSLVDWQ